VLGVSRHPFKYTPSFLLLNTHVKEEEAEAEEEADEEEAEEEEEEVKRRQTMAIKH
jgi:hypothetical protein